MDLLMNLMEWSQSQTGRIEFTPKTLEVVSLINEIALLFDDIAGQKSITIKRSLPPNALVVADKAMISTVLRNLISNAIKFSYPDGEIVISAKEIKNELTVSVTDNGVGISKASINELFRIDKNHSTQGTLNEKGTGLGLVLCKEFVEKHGGKIWVESEEGKGSTFYFTIPLSLI
jgi:signal transduction histidine kinase